MEKSVENVGSSVTFMFENWQTSLINLVRNLIW